MSSSAAEVKLGAAPGPKLKTIDDVVDEQVLTNRILRDIALLLSRPSCVEAVEALALSPRRGGRTTWASTQNGTESGGSLVTSSRLPTFDVVPNEAGMSASLRIPSSPALQKLQQKEAPLPPTASDAAGGQTPSSIGRADSELSSKRRGAGHCIHNARSPTASSDGESKQTHREETLLLKRFPDEPPHPVLKVHETHLSGTFVQSDRGHDHNIAFDFGKLQAWSALPAIMSRCSVFRLQRTLLYQLTAQLALVLVIILGVRGGGVAGASADEEDMEEEDQGGGDRRLARRLAAIELQTAVQSVSELTTYLNRLVPFLLGLFISLCLRRWWTIRSSYLQRIYSCGAQLSFWLRMSLPDKASWVRRRVERDFLLAHKLVYMGANFEREPEMLRQLRDENQISDVEYHRLLLRLNSLPNSMVVPDGVYDFDFAMLPFFWSAHLIYRVFSFGIATKGAHNISIPPPVLVKMLTYCMEARKGVENIAVMLSTPLPYPYVHLVCILVHLSALFQCVESGLTLATQPDLGAYHIVCEGVFIVAMNSLYCGLLCLAVVLWNPFGDDIVDFPAPLLHHQLWKSQMYATHFLDNDNLLDAMLHRTFEDGSCKKSHHEDDEEDPDEDEDEVDDDDGGGD